MAGYTTLIYEMKEVMDDLTAGKYVRKMVKADAAVAADVDADASAADDDDP